MMLSGAVGHFSLFFPFRTFRVFRGEMFLALLLAPQATLYAFFTLCLRDFV